MPEYNHLLSEASAMKQIAFEVRSCNDIKVLLSRISSRIREAAARGDIKILIGNKNDSLLYGKMMGKIVEVLENYGYDVDYAKGGGFIVSWWRA